MFQQHPVPQQISSYQFRLVGDMTLKQFFQLAGGAVIGLLLYASPLPAIFKWPLIIFFVVMGAAFAFLPLQERPLSEWILAFFRSAYGPTLFIWTKPQSTASYFAPEEGSTAQTPVATTSVPLEPHLTKLEETEKSILSRVSGLFNIPGKSLPPTPVAQTQNTNPTEKVLVATAPVIAQATVITSALTPNVGNRPIEAPTPMRSSAYIPATAKVGVEHKQGFAAEDAKSQDQTAVANTPVSNTQTFTPTTTNTPDAVSAKFSPDAAPPTPPSQANIVVGQVMDANGKIVSGAIMEIKDQMGRPVRAFKTNQAGHFMIVTPLTDGQYKIFVERDDLTFDPINLEAKGAILPPIAIRARNSM